ncbi:hypothetical protein [Irregularibacter muris]|uniref:hypothetical protein n=1 Tax=Irregularibacter muris TaxID=1796619 RepID=UPI00214B2BE6|nr:hypothetical protein [Irregularibacter muris]
MAMLILILSIALVSFQYGQTSTVRTMSTFFSPPEQPLPPNIDELLKKDYGNSKYFDTHEDIKISLEKIIKEKYFIEYSWVNGEESYFGIGLLIENVNKKKLKKEDFNSLWIKDNLGNTYTPLPYQTINDFPQDRPLGWKQLFYGKFSPMDPQAETMDIYFKYKEHQFKIPGIPL